MSVCNNFGSFGNDYLNDIGNVLHYQTRILNLFPEVYVMH